MAKLFELQREILMDTVFQLDWWLWETFCMTGQERHLHLHCVQKKTPTHLFFHISMS